jgi:ABC-type iron transport system FetAB permease component
MSTNSIYAKLLVNAFCAALSALVLGFFLVRMIKHFDSLSVTVMVLFGVSLIADLWWTRREVRRLAANKIASKAPTQFLWSCIFFSMLSFGLGIAVSGLNWFGTDFIPTFNLVFWSAMTGIAIYLVWRDAKCLGNAARAGS